MSVTYNERYTYTYTLQCRLRFTLRDGKYLSVWRIQRDRIVALKAGMNKQMID